MCQIFKTSWNITTSFNVAPFAFYNAETDLAEQHYNSNIGAGILLMCMVAYFSKMNEFCCHGALFLWHLGHFMNMRCFSNMVAMATLMWRLNKMSSKLIEMIRYYASCMNAPSLTDSKKLWFLTLFRCVLLSTLQIVVRSLLSAGGPYFLSVHHFLYLFTLFRTFL